MAQPPAAMNTAARDLLNDLQTQNGFNTTELKLINDIVSKVLNPQSLPAPEAAATAPIVQHDAEQGSTAAGQLPTSNSQLDMAKMSAGLAKLSQLRASQNLPKLQDALAAGTRSQPQQRSVSQIKELEAAEQELERQIQVLSRAASRRSTAEAPAAVQRSPAPAPAPKTSASILLSAAGPGSYSQLHAKAGSGPDIEPGSQQMQRKPSGSSRSPQIRPTSAAAAAPTSGKPSVAVQLPTYSFPSSYSPGAAGQHNNHSAIISPRMHLMSNPVGLVSPRDRPSGSGARPAPAEPAAGGAPPAELPGGSCGSYREIASHRLQTRSFVQLEQEAEEVAGRLANGQQQHAGAGRKAQRKISFDDGAVGRGRSQGAGGERNQLRCSSSGDKSQEEVWKESLRGVNGPLQRRCSADDEERLARLYARTTHWRTECAKRYEQVRLEKEANATQGCTFQPRINKNSKALHRDGVHYPAKPIVVHAPRSHSPTRSSSPPRPASPGRARAAPSPQSPAARSVSAAAIAQQQRQQEQDMLVDAMAVAAATGSPGDRLYAAAVLQRQRQEERNRLQQQADRAATQWVAPRSAYQVVPRVYEEPAAPGSKAKPAEELFTFQPRTNSNRSLSPRPGSKPLSPRAAEQWSPAEYLAAAGKLTEPVAAVLRSIELGRKESAAAQLMSTAKSGISDVSSYPIQVDASVDASIASMRSLAKGSPLASPRAEGASPNLRVKSGSQGAHATGGFPGFSPTESPMSQRSLPASARSPVRSPGSRAGSAFSEANWDEFNERQQNFIRRKEAKLEMAAQAAQPRAEVWMAPGSLRILHSRSRQEGEQGAGSPAGGQGSAAGTPSSARSSSRSPSFKPQITRKGAAMRPRTLEEMSQGDRLKKEAWLEQQRILAEVKEIETATFRPQSYTAGSPYAAVPPRLQLNDPEAYNAQLAAKQQRAELRRQQQVLERLTKEMAECTFHPETTPLPRYLLDGGPNAANGYAAQYQELKQQHAFATQQLAAQQAALQAAQDEYLWAAYGGAGGAGGEDQGEGEGYAGGDVQGEGPEEAGEENYQELE